ncbi:MAG: uncharacterized protein KVP18_005145 [Porospora cf. gigantea A]|uniref:uncharacterized protein n=1 Tax=Porospora cf. gigantea A TaxID=2853593 RepID=UPI0035595C86|nr:MAG: hypothetical protein KVP18_005145 [Porospora cf. gigantea A]
MLSVETLQTVLATQLDGTVNNVVVASLDGGIIALARTYEVASDFQSLQHVVALVVSIFSEYLAFSDRFRAQVAEFKQCKVVVGTLGSEALMLAVIGDSGSDVEHLRRKVRQGLSYHSSPLCTQC